MSRWLVIILPILIACSVIACNELENDGRLLYPCAEAMALGAGDNLNRDLTTAINWSAVMNWDFAMSGLLAIVSIGLSIAWISALIRLLYLRFRPARMEISGARGFDVMT